VAVNRIQLREDGAGIELIELAREDHLHLSSRLNREICECSRSPWLWFCDEDEKAYYALENCFVLHLDDRPASDGVHAGLDAPLIGEVLKKSAEVIGLPTVAPATWWSDGLVLLVDREGEEVVLVGGRSREYTGDSYIYMETLAKVDNQGVSELDVLHFQYEIAGFELFEWPIFSISFALVLFVLTFVADSLRRVVSRI